MKEWREEMGEISGFGGGYEATCRAMVLAGIDWIDQHPSAKLEFTGFKNVFGLVTEDNKDAQDLVAAMLATPVFLNGEKIAEQAKNDCTGAMHHAAVQHCLAYQRLGWEEYCRQLVEREQAEQAEEECRAER